VNATLFWEMLAAYETATILEARTIGLRDFAQLEELSSRKAELLISLKGCASRLGLDRRDPALRDRLEALQQAERMNLEALDQLVSQVRSEVEGVMVSRRRLSSLRGVYTSGHSDGGFFSEA